MQKILLFTLFWMLFAGCDAATDPLPGGPYELFGLEGEKIVYVAGYTETCTGLIEQECLLVKEKPEDNWEYWYDDLKGFEYSEGTNYVLRIQEKEIENPPQDASSIEWIYVETLDSW